MTGTGVMPGAGAFRTLEACGPQEKAPEKAHETRVEESRYESISFPLSISTSCRIDWNRAARPRVWHTGLGRPMIGVALGPCQLVSGCRSPESSSLGDRAKFIPPITR